MTAAPDEESLAMMMARAREQMMGQVRQVYTNTLDEVIRQNLLPMSPTAKEAQAIAISVAAAAVTAAQLMSDRQLFAFTRQMGAMKEAFDERLKVLEAAGAQVKVLADQLADALERLGTPTREEFARISHEVFGIEKPGVVVGEPTPSMLAKMGVMRRAVPLQPSELQADFVYAGGLQPPEGHRWESDDELRARLKVATGETLDLVRLNQAHAAMVERDQAERVTIASVTVESEDPDRFAHELAKPPEA